MLYDFEKTYLRRTLKLLPLLEEHRVECRPSASLVAAGVKNLESLGFTVDGAVVKNLLESNRNTVTSTLQRMFSVLSEKVGADVAYTPFYPNFPAQVAEASDAELYVNAILHYFGDAIGVRITPEYEKQLRGAFDPVATKAVTLGSLADAKSMVADLAANTQPFTDADKADLRGIFAEDPKFLLKSLPERIEVKENLVFLITVFEPTFAEYPDRWEAFEESCRTATDVLRLAVGLSGGDVSLADPRPVFTSFSRPRRRLLMDLFEASSHTSNMVEDMLRRPEQFKRLGERLHPGEFAKKAPRTVEAFRVIRDGEKVATYNSKVEGLLETARATGVLPDGLLGLLVSRPGDFARRLDAVLRVFDAPHEDQSKTEIRHEIVKAFKGVAPKVSVKVLFQLGNHYMNRNNGNDRLTVAKGGASVVLNDALEPFTAPNVDKLVMRAVGNGLREQFATRGSLGKVFIDDAMGNYTVPVSIQDSSAASHTLGRFSRTPLPEGEDILRFFIHWKDGEHRTDVDLSALLLDERFVSKNQITYYNLRSGYAQHSGDFTSAPNGAAEFIDIDVKRAVADGIRYVVMDVRGYTQQNFCDIPECYAGYMGRATQMSGEVFEPSTVEHKVTLTAPTNSAFVYVFDLVKREAVWCDLSMNIKGGHQNNLEFNRDLVSGVARAAASNQYLSLADLFMLHASARGELVTDRADADLVFAEDGDVTPYDIEKIMSQFM